MKKSFITLFLFVLIQFSLSAHATNEGDASFQQDSPEDIESTPAEQEEPPQSNDTPSKSYLPERRIHWYDVRKSPVPYQDQKYLSENRQEYAQLLNELIKEKVLPRLTKTLVSTPEIDSNLMQRVGRGYWGAALDESWWKFSAHHPLSAVDTILFEWKMEPYRAKQVKNHDCKMNFYIHDHSLGRSDNCLEGVISLPLAGQTAMSRSTSSLQIRMNLKTDTEAIYHLKVNYYPYSERGLQQRAVSYGQAHLNQILNNMAAAPQFKAFAKRYIKTALADMEVYPELSFPY